MFAIGKTKVAGIFGDGNFNFNFDSFSSSLEVIQYLRSLNLSSSRSNSTSESCRIAHEMFDRPSEGGPGMVSATPRIIGVITDRELAQDDGWLQQIKLMQVVSLQSNFILFFNELVQGPWHIYACDACQQLDQ